MRSSGSAIAGDYNRLAWGKAMKEGTVRPELPKRFYKTVSIGEEDGGFAVLLDGRPVRTPARHPLTVPVRAVADVIAVEWDAQTDRVDPTTMPMTRLTNTVIDGVAQDLDAVRQDAGRYIETDLLFYRAGGPDRLVERQTERWDPIIRIYEDELGVRFTLAEGVMHTPQPTMAIELFKARLAEIADAFQLAGFHQMTTLTGSALLALAVADGHLDVDEAWALAHLDEDWNIEQWGEDEEAVARRARRFEDMKVAALMVSRLERRS
ncbi:ATP12 family chaperone protein [Consotaella aegiceratis]|uniref:ATP12 family chaperone protein n=1 Tax=Consotaella aegiceratis TaxID=3097961 RepID=UPI002F40F3DF